MAVECSHDEPVRRASALLQVDSYQPLLVESLFAYAAVSTALLRKAVAIVHRCPRLRLKVMDALAWHFLHSQRARPKLGEHGSAFWHLSQELDPAVVWVEVGVFLAT